MNTDNRDTQILRFLAGDLPEAEAAALETWRQADATNEAHFADLQQLWSATQPTKAPLPVVVDTEWERLEQRLALDTASASQPARARILPIQWAWRATAIAASLLLLISIGWWLRPAPETTILTVATQTNETRLVTLPDGSTVLLNGNTMLSYAEAFADERRLVSLEGEAFFNVESGTRPFVVAGKNAEVEVLGTEFNVQTRNATTHVAVREGRVALSGSEARIELTAGEAAIHDGTATPQRVTDATTEPLDWLNVQIAFERTPLSDVFAELMHRFGTPIQLAAPSLATETLTASFDNRTLEQILTSICAANACEATSSDSGYVVQTP